MAHKITQLFLANVVIYNLPVSVSVCVSVSGYGSDGCPSTPEYLDLATNTRHQNQTHISPEETALLTFSN